MVSPRSCLPVLSGIMLADWYQSIANGKQLNKAMKEWVPPGEAMLIQAGEASGVLAEGFENAISSTKAASDMKSAIMGAMAYPALLLTMLFGIIYLFSTQAVPKLAAAKDPETWPAVSKVLWDLSLFVETKWWVVIVSMIAFIYFCSWSTKYLTGPIRKGLDFIPPWSIYKSFQSSVFLISVSAMMKSGTPLFNSVSSLKSMSSRYVQGHLKIIMVKLETGKNVGEAMNNGFLDKETGIDIKIFGQTADVDKAMESIGRTSIKNSIENIKKIASLVNILAMASVAGFIGWVYYSFVTLSQSIGQAPM